jgi:hypothetical protein
VKRAGLPAHVHGSAVKKAQVRIAYERAVFHSELHRVTNFIAGIVATHSKKAPEDEWIRPVLSKCKSGHA